MDDPDPRMLLEVAAREALARYGRLLERALHGRAGRRELELAEARFLSIGGRLREARARRRI